MLTGGLNRYIQKILKKTSSPLWNSLPIPSQTVSSD